MTVRINPVTTRVRDPSAPRAFSISSTWPASKQVRFWCGALGATPTAGTGSRPTTRADNVGQCGSRSVRRLLSRSLWRAHAVRVAPTVEGAARARALDRPGPVEAERVAARAPRAALGLEATRVMQRATLPPPRVASKSSECAPVSGLAIPVIILDPIPPTTTVLSRATGAAAARNGAACPTRRTRQSTRVVRESSPVSAARRSVSTAGGSAVAGADRSQRVPE